MAADASYRARIERVTRDGAQLLLLEETKAAQEPAVRLTVAQAVLKGDHMDEVVRDATMMGVSAIEPLLTERTIVRAKGLADGKTADRWRRVAIASAKQCRRAVLPIIGSGTEFHEWLLQDDAERRLLLVEPGAPVESRSVGAVSQDRPSSATVLIGPEGGWSPAEIDAAAAAATFPSR